MITLHEMAETGIKGIVLGISAMTPKGKKPTSPLFVKKNTYSSLCYDLL